MKNLGGSLKEEELVGLISGGNPEVINRDHVRISEGISGRTKGILTETLEGTLRESLKKFQRNFEKNHLRNPDKIR